MKTLTLPEIEELVAQHAPTHGAPFDEREAAALRLAAAFPETPWRIDARDGGGRGGSPSHRGTVRCNGRLARRLLSADVGSSADAHDPAPR